MVQEELRVLHLVLKADRRGWGFSSVVERLPRKRKALGSVPSSGKKNQKKKKKKNCEGRQEKTGVLRQLGGSSQSPPS